MEKNIPEKAVTVDYKVAEVTRGCNDLTFAPNVKVNIEFTVGFGLLEDIAQMGGALRLEDFTDKLTEYMNTEDTEDTGE